MPEEHLERLLPVIDEFVIDIKDMNPLIYREYTGMDNARVIENLKWIACAGKADRCLIRIPLIPGYNTDDDRARSIADLEALGFTRFDKFEYKTDINK